MSLHSWCSRSQGWKLSLWCTNSDIIELILISSSLSLFNQWWWIWWLQSLISFRLLQIKLYLCAINWKLLPILELPLRHKLNIKFATFFSECNPLETKLINLLCSIISGGIELLIWGRNELCNRCNRWLFFMKCFCSVSGNPNGLSLSMFTLYTIYHVHFDNISSI